MSSWEHCIISLIDLIDIKKKLFDEKSNGIDLMRQMHHIVQNQITEMHSHNHAYYWNDSVLLLAYVDDKKTLYEPVMKEVKGPRKNNITISRRTVTKE